VRINRRFVSQQMLADKSIQRQRALGEQVARRLDATIVREYVDLSGAVLLGNRPELQAMLRSLTNFPVQYVIVEEWGVLSGKPDDAAAILSAITDAGAELVVGDGALGRSMAQMTSWPHEPTKKQT